MALGVKKQMIQTSTRHGPDPGDFALIVDARALTVGPAPGCYIHQARFLANEGMRVLFVVKSETIFHGYFSILTQTREPAATFPLSPHPRGGGRAR